MAIATWPAALYYEFGFNAPAGQNSIPPFWTNLSARVLWAWQTKRGRQYELDTNPTGTWNFALQNADGALDPDNTASPYAGNLVPYRCARIRSLTGVNQLTVDQATAGQASGLSGSIPARLHVANDQGYALNIVTSGSAYQGSQVYQATLTTGASAGASILLVQQVPVIPGNWYAFQAQARITAGNSAATNATVTWWDQNGNNLGTQTGGNVALTSGAGTWTQIPASGQAPTTCYSATLKVEIATGTLTGSTTWQIDGLQWENSATPTPWQMPGVVSQNLFPRPIATGSACISLINDAVTNYWVASGANGGTISQAQYLTAAPTGQTTALAWTTPAGTTSSNAALNVGNWLGLSAPGPQPDCVQVAPLLAYTASWYAMRTASADATLQVAAQITWYASTGLPISTSTGTAATVPAGSWSSRITVSATAPVGAAWAVISEAVSSPATTTASNTIYHSGWQFEQAAAATTWVDPGPTYQIFNGSVERWPQSWELSGTYGKIDAVGVDNLALLSQDIIPSPFVAEVLAMNPDFFYQLNDPSGSTSCVDTSGNRPAAPVETSPFGSGSLALGSPITSTSPPGGFIGTQGPVATFTNTVSGPGLQKAETFVDIGATTVTPGPPQSGSWTRAIHFRSTNTPAASTEMNLWTAYPPSWNAGNLSSFWFQIGPGGIGSINVANASNFGTVWNGTTNLCDGNWHQMIALVDAAGTGGQFIRLYLDGALMASNTVAARYPTGIVTDVIGCSITTGTNSYCQGLIGDVACALELPFALTQAQVANLYNSWRTASAGDSSGQRTQRVLTWSAYSGPTAIDAGATMSMGAATDVAGSTAIDTSTALLPGGVAFTGGSAVQALNTIAQSENGNVYCANSGAIAFTARTDRYNRTVPAFIFGEHDYAGEWPYELVRTDFDPSHLYTAVQVTQYASGQIATARSATAAFNYGQRVNQLTMNQAAWTETQDAADYLLGRYQSANTRIPAIKLHPSAVPGLFAVCLQLEIGTRIRVMRRPPNAPARAYELFVESVAWSVDPTTGKALVTLQCSPADLAAYWTLGSLHTTLSAQAASGQAQATINALPDAAVNVLASSLPSGYQLVFEPGTARQETMTIAPGGIPSTGVGYTTALLTFATNFSFTHATGSTVCEVLPTGVTDPTTYDLASILGALGTTVNAAATSGTNVITVNALPDAKANAANSDWTTGDLIWIGPGTANFEGYNLLGPNVSTAGEGMLPLAVGTVGSTVGVASALGTPTVTASATAFQGANVWQVLVSASGTSGFRLIRASLPAVPGQAYSASFYVRSATSGANPQVGAQLVFLNAAGGTAAVTTSTAVTLTGSATAAWTRVTVTATAPAAAVSIQAGVVLAATGPASPWTFQADGLQVEGDGTVSPYQTCPQIQSVGASVPGYSTVTLTLASNLANNHAVGEAVCDPLPAGVTSPAAAPGTARITY